MEDLEQHRRVGRLEHAEIISKVYMVTRVTATQMQSYLHAWSGDGSPYCNPTGKYLYRSAYLVPAGCYLITFCCMWECSSCS